MDFLVFSDLHAHPFKFGSKWVVDEQLGPINSRLLDACKCIRQVYAYACEHDIKNVVFAGDLFHVPDRPPTEAVTAVYKTIAANQPFVTTCMIPGNHDISSKNGLSHALVPFSKIAQVATHYEWFDLYPGVRLHLVPYRESKSAYLSMANEAAAAASEYRSHHPTTKHVLISHIGVQGAKVGANYVLVHDSDVDVKELPLDAFDLCLFGHFHEHQKLAHNAYYVGSTNQHNWGDVGSERGFLHVSVGDSVTIKRVPLDAPKFHSLAVGDSVSHVNAGDFVTINAGKKVVEAVKKAALESLPDVAFLDIKPEKEVLVLDHVKMPNSWSHNELLTAWVDANCPAKLKKNKLLNLGLKFLGEAHAEEE